MHSIDLRVTLFEDEADRERSERAMHFVLHALCCIDFEYIRHHRTPRLYRSGVRYDNERAGKKEWYDIGKVLEQRRGDCKDLACWLVAEHWTLGLRSRPFIRYRTFPYVDEDGGEKRFSLYHVMVQRPNGSIEDPSRTLGMDGSALSPTRREARFVSGGIP